MTARPLMSPWWGRVAATCVALIGALIVTLQLRQAERTREVIELGRELREVRLDMSKGFLHLMQADEAGGAPFTRERGVALLRQGLAKLGENFQPSDVVATREFEENVREFRDRFEGWTGREGPGEVAELRASFHALEREAELLDAAAQARLRDISARNRREFLAATGAALVLLGLFSAVVLRVQRARARAERELREREARFRGMTEGLPQLVWTWRADGACDYLNRRWLDYCGGDLASQLGDGWLEQVHTEEREVFLRVAREAMEHGVGFHSQIRLRRHDGDYRWFDVSVLPLNNAEGEIVQWLGSCTDVQIDHELREAAETERNFSEAMIDSLPGVFYLYDRRGKFLRWNRNFERVTGYTSAEIAGMHPLDFFAGEDRARVEERIGEVFSVGTSEVEAGFVSKDGSVTPYFFTGLTTEHDGCPCLIGVGIDITARKQAENEVRALNETLEQRVALRTAELQAKNRELETFTYSVSHDLKAPLRGIDGYSRLLLEDYADKLDDEGRRVLNSVRHASVQMGQLIDDLLAYSQLERRTITVTAVSPRSVFDSLPVSYAEEAAERGVALAVELPDVMVNADPNGLAQVLRNLIDNALKFTRGVEAPSIELGGRVEGDKAILWVRDNGIGFDMKFTDRIFDIFQRLHRAEDYPGTGIGLAIVRKAMERMGGRVSAESAPGKGATFFLEIPIHRS